MPTLEQIQVKLKKLQAQADALITKKAQIAIDQIRELMLKHGLTTADIEAQAKARRAAKGLNGHAASGKLKPMAAGQKIPKYRDHKTGATWTGHGRAPGWIAGAKDRSVFLIDGASESKPSASGVATRAKRKGQPKGAQPSKYRDPATGATWSGRGPAPRWLAAGKDRTRFLIDGKATSAAASGAVSKKAAAKKVVAKKAKARGQSAATKKAVVKPAAKKAAARKVTAKKAAAKAPGRKKAAASELTTSAAAPLASTAASA
ncbi:MAG: histone protein [uncultured Paraburkholderia sp.]|nr:MAG: histone protein [uncultured Paraburkholderia sp.]CAH2795435.1 MAG: histone protein [uncultured Paraburkholderia sp.]CAH2930824.1 MAG: histone protein [uncultured Paraburkholderia sp.]